MRAHESVRLVDSRGKGFVLVAITGFFLALTVGEIGRSQKAQIAFLPLDHFLPEWAATAVNIVLMAVVFLLLLSVLLEAGGKERLLFLGILASLIADFTQRYTSARMALPLQYADAAAMIFAFAVSLWILRGFFPSRVA